MLALAVPLLFLHTYFLPGVTVHGARANLADFAAVAVIAAGLWAGSREGFEPLRAGRWLWIAAVVFFVVIAASTAYGAATDSGYLLGKHSVTALKLLEYALMAPAVVLIVRRRRDLELLFASVTVWTVAALVYGLLQFFNVINDFSVGHKRAGEREPSFLGPHDFAALSSMALALAIAAVALGPIERRERRWVVVAGVVGAIGLVLSGAIAGVLGLGLAALAAAFVAWRRKKLSLGPPGWARRDRRRGAPRHARDALERRFAVPQVPRDQAGRVTGLARRLELLATNGARVFRAQDRDASPRVRRRLAGICLRGRLPARISRAARRRFPDVAPLAFPSPQHRWGVQNLYLQAAADMGIIGLAALVWLFGSGLLLGGRWAMRAPPAGAAFALVPVLWLLMAVGIWNGLGIVAGIPLVAMTWLSLGLVAVRVD